MIHPKTTWRYSKLTEALRILQIAYWIKNQFYFKKNFFVLPYNVPQNPKVIYFPRSNYQKIKGFWAKLKDNSETLLNKKDSLIDQIGELVPDDDLDYSILQKDWLKVEKKFWQIINQLLPDWFSEIKSLEIRPTNYGSITTAYSTWIKKNNHLIVVYLRSDADVSHLVEAILLDRLNRMTNSNDYTWEEIEAISDFLISQTELARLFPNYKQTLFSIRQKQQGNLAKDSNKYLKYLGFRTENIFNLKDGQILAFGKQLKVGLSVQEEKLFRFLISNKQKLVSFDEIADLLWDSQSYDKFSPYAITKLTQRLRDKIESMAVFPGIIQTIKKRGYILLN